MEATEQENPSAQWLEKPPANPMHLTEGEKLFVRDAAGKRARREQRENQRRVAEEQQRAANAATVRLADRFARRPNRQTLLTGLRAVSKAQKPSHDYVSGWRQTAYRN